MTDRTLDEAMGMNNAEIVQLRARLHAAAQPAEPCAQCGTLTRQLADSEHGPLCPQCAHRQHEHDEARERYDHLAPSTFGFLGDDI